MVYKERDSIKQRQKEGIEIAKAKGIRFGRPKATKPNNWQRVYTEWENKKISAVKAMELTNLKANTFYKFVSEEKSA